MPPKYDFAAAHQLSQQLSQLVEKMDWFIWLRESQSEALLGGPGSDNWRGAKRDNFVTHYLREQSALIELRDAAFRLQSQVNNATDAAHAAEKAEKNKH
ncbi:hypothetical protein [Streptomyces milbemycinicus]|uniref:Uncharacterized protein n=1 Tax=Streptomyces milbemycinicus TaxID=476552 RepID=A0ABW8LMQ7_9ACTN